MNIYPDVYILPIPTPTLPPHQHTNSFLVGENSLFLIDSGLYNEELIKVLLRYLARNPGSRLEKLFLTHRHPDHRIGAEEIRSRTGCEVGIHRQEADRMQDLSVDFLFDQGDQFLLDGRVLTVIHTPGHSIGHCCFFLESRAVLFTGDHVLGAGTSIIVPPEGDMSVYMDSLNHLLTYPVQVLCPGHGPVVWEAKEKIREYLEHRRKREAAILLGLEKGLTSIEALVTRIYTDVPGFMHGMAWFSVQAHLIKLEREGKVRKKEDDEGYEIIRY